MEPRKSLVDIVEKISSMMGEFEDKALNSDELSDLTVKQLYYLDMVKKLNNPTFTDLSEEIGVTKPTVTTAINKLIKQGHIEKIQSVEDRRVYNLLLTEEGERVVDIHDKAHKDFARMISNSLNDQELNKVVDIFTKVIECQ